MPTVKSWTSEDVSHWLAEIGFEKLVEGFCQEEVDGELLLELTNEELKDEFGLKLGDRKKLLAQILELKQADELPRAAVLDSHSQKPMPAMPNFDKLYLLDGRNIACQGESFEKPSLTKLRKALSWHLEHRPDWKVLAFVYEALVDQWKEEHPEEMSPLSEQLIITPRREDVDKFIIRKAVDATKSGSAVRIVSNDNFRDYIGELRDFNFSEDWVREHVVKFCFAGDDFIPADGFGEALPPMNQPKPSEQLLREVAELAEPPGLPVLLTGRGAQHPSQLQIAAGVQEVRCPHRRCPLRMSIKESKGGFVVQMTGLETPAARAEQPILKLRRQRSLKTWCPTCKRPLELRSQRAEQVPMNRCRRRGKGTAFVTVLFGPDEELLQRFVLGALVLGHSLKMSETRFDLVLLHTADVMNVPGAGLLEVYWTTREVDYLEADSKLTCRSEERFRHVFTKLQVFGCDDYERVVLLDIDLLVRDNIDELAYLKPPCALRRGHKSLPMDVDVSLSCYDRQGRPRFGMNLGVAVLKPSQEELQKMQASIRSRDPMHEASNGPEQDFLSRWFKNWASMDLKYNYQLHQLAHSMDHAGAEAERLQLRFDNVKVLHYSGKLKPWDYYFEGSQSFSSFCEDRLLPAYIPHVGEGSACLKEKIRRAATEWNEQCKAMWQDLVRRCSASGRCQLCDQDVPSEMQLEHCFVQCPEISALAELRVTPEEVRHPEPQEFPRILACVAGVLERRRWLARAKETEEGNTSEEETCEPISETQDSRGSTSPGQSSEAVAKPSLPATPADPKVLHLVLQPQRSYEDSPLGRFREKIMQEVATNRVTIIVAPTGCGKSTRIPQMILDEDRESRILVTQPRRIAATSLARRVAAHRGVALGSEVGYKIGGCSEVCRSGGTRLIFATTAIAMIQCLQDCSSFTHLIIDEVHIRDAHIDFLLSLVVTKVLRHNTQVKIILMSAAMDAAKIATYFASGLGGTVPKPLDLEQCRPFRLDIKYMDDLPFFRERSLSRRGQDGAWEQFGIPAEWSQEEVSDLYADFIRWCHEERARRKDLASFLIFLPGKREVTLLRERLEEIRNLKVQCIFGGQTIEEQERVLSESQDHARTVILGTDVIESSVTIPDVDLVIDTCEQKRLRWDAGRKQSLLTLVLVSQDEAKQRSGRTGRVRDGEVVRLISKESYDRLQKHAEPQIKHSRLEDLLLSIFELPNLGDPREFLSKMPDPPPADRVDRAIVRLLELNALAKSKTQDQGAAKPTYFGRFLQKMPLDPDVGFLVMSGVRLNLVKDCAILAAVHQRGDPFLDSVDLSLEEVQALWEVRDACSPGRAKGRVRPLPGDLMAGLGAYKAWQVEVEGNSHWSIQDEALWCAQHFLSLERLRELEEMVVQIHDVLEELGYASSLPLAEKERMRKRRREKVDLTVARVRPRMDAAQKFWVLLHGQRDRDTDLLLAWCIAASFTAGLIDVKNGSSTEQLKYGAKTFRSDEFGEVLRSDEIGEVLRAGGFRVADFRILARGDAQVTFQNPEEAHKAFQQAALINNNAMPWTKADPWGRPQQRTSLQPRQCYRGPPVRIISSSQAWLATSENAVLVAGEVLAIMNHKRTAMTYFCTKCSTVPYGITPLILCATYPAAQVTAEAGLWKVTTNIYGQTQEERYTEPPKQVAGLLLNIRKQMDTEFGCNQQDRQRIVEERKRNVLELMRLLDGPDTPPMRSLDDIHPAVARVRGANVRAGLDFSSLVNLLTNDLDNFRL